MPKMTLFAPDSPFSQLVSPAARAASGGPSTTNISMPTISVDTSGITTTGMMPATERGTLILRIAQHDGTGQQARDQAAEEPGLDLPGDVAADDAGHQRGPVGHGEGDEAGQDRHQETEGDPADLEHQRGPRLQAAPVELLGRPSVR